MGKKPTTIHQAMAALPPEQMLAMDIPRQWASAAQVMVNPDFTFIIFREQNKLDVDLEGVPPDEHIVLKNVASIVMPTPVARELLTILRSQIESIDG